MVKGQDQNSKEASEKMTRQAKYIWCDIEFDRWCKEQAAKLKENGIEIGTRGITRVIHKKIIIPNQITLSELVTPKIKINRGKWKRRMI